MSSSLDLYFLWSSPLVLVFVVGVVIVVVVVEGTTGMAFAVAVVVVFGEALVMENEDLR